MTLVRAFAACSLLLLAATAGCSNRPAAEAAAGAAEATATAGVSKDTLKPMRSSASEGPAAESVAGVVAETMDAGGYTYVRLSTADRGEVWAAASQFDVRVGDRVVVAVDMPMENFHSDTLNRDFPLIYFASSIGPEGAAPKGAQVMPPGHPPTGTPRAAVERPAEAIAPPPGGTAIADVWANRQALAGKAVTVRGKVMKFNAGIMGRNWVHLQDGTGNDKDGTHDLTVTTDAEVKPGDLVTLRGTLALDKDFTAGYRYAIILEGATIVR